MRIGRHETEDRMVLVADLSRGHRGRAAAILERLPEIAHAGADAVALAAVEPARQYAAQLADRIEACRRDRLTSRDLQSIAAEARRLGLATIIGVSDRDTLRASASDADGWWIDAADADFGVLLDAAGADGRPVLLDVAAPDELRVEATVARIRTAVDIGAHGAAASARVAAMHRPPAGCADDELSLCELLLLATSADATGFVDRPRDAGDHTAATAAAALGVDIVLRPCPPDSVDAFAAMAAAVRRVESMLAPAAWSHEGDTTSSGRGQESSAASAGIQQSSAMSVTDASTATPEAAAKTAAVSPGVTPHPVAWSDALDDAAVPLYRVIVAARDLEAGRVLGFGDIDWRRGREGWRFGDEPLILGRRLARPVSAGFALAEPDFAARPGG